MKRIRFIVVLLARKEEIADFFAASSPPHSAFLSISVSSRLIEVIVDEE